MMPADLDLARVQARLEEWMRAGRVVYKSECLGDEPMRPSDIIRQAEESA